MGPYRLSRFLFVRRGLLGYTARMADTSASDRWLFPHLVGWLLLLIVGAFALSVWAAGGMYLADAIALTVPVAAIAWVGYLMARHRRFQYSLRTLLLLVLVWSISCSWLAVRMQQAQRQREVVEAIKRTGGQVWYDTEGEPGVPWLRRLFERLFGEDFFKTVVRAEASDEQWKQLRLALPNCKIERYQQED